MNFKSFLKEEKEKKKVIITDDIQNVNNLIFRLCEDGEKVGNVNVVTIIDIAKEIVMNEVLSKKNGNICDFNYINRDSAVSIIGKILNKLGNKIKFVNEDSFCTATYREVYENVNLIRLNKKENVPNKSSLKNDMDLIIKEFNKELEDNKYYDDARIILEANEFIKNQKSEESIIYALCDFNHSFSKSERDLIEKVSNSNIELLEIDKEDGKKEIVFKECYGYFNEVNEILLDLDKKKISETVILYTDDIYYPYIKSVFGSSGIETTFTTGFKASNVNYIKDIRYILNFAINNYNYKDLKPLCLDALMSFIDKKEQKTDEKQKIKGEKKTKGEEKVKEDKKSISLIKQFEKGIGLEISCKLETYSDFTKSKDYNDFIKKRYPEDKKDKIDDNKKIVICEEYYDFIKCIVKLFEDYHKDKKLSTLILGLMKFIDEYKGRGNEDLNRYNQAIRSKLFEISESLELMDNFDDDREGLIYLDSLLDKLTLSDSYKHGMLEVQKLNKTKVFNKKNIYIIGLTTKQYLGNNAESPVLSDESRKELCEYQYEGEKYNLQLVHDEENMKREYLFDTCDYLLNDSNVNVFCSKYDQMNNYPLSRAPIFSQLMDKFGVNKITEAEYSYPILDKEYIFDAKKEFEKIEDSQKVNNKKITVSTTVNNEEFKSDEDPGIDNDTGNDNKNGKQLLVFSHSGLKEFLNCSVQYYYNHILHLKAEDYIELGHDNWLDPLKRGSMVHEILQQYVEKVFKTTSEKASKKKYQKEIDEKLFNEICDNVFSKYNKIIQSASKEIIEKTIEDIKQKLKDYLVRMHKEFADKENEWYVEDCEVSFGSIFDKDNKKSKEKETLYCAQEFSIDNKDDTKKGEGKKKSGTKKNEEKKEDSSNNDESNVEKIYFTGRIDRIDKSKKDPKKVRIVDYKTGNTKKFIEDIANDKQHHIYALCFKDDKKNKDNSVEFRYEFIDYSDYADNLDTDGKVISQYDIKNSELKPPLEEKVFNSIKSFINGDTKLSSIKYTKSKCAYCKYGDICALKLNAIQDKK